MPEAGSTSLLRDGVLLLGAAGMDVLLFRRLNLGATLGYLVAGEVIGPSGWFPGSAGTRSRRPGSGRW